MTKSMVGMIEEFAGQVEELAGPTVRSQVMMGSESITASAGRVEVARWVKGAIGRLDEARRREPPSRSWKPAARIAQPSTTA